MIHEVISEWLASSFLGWIEESGYHRVWSSGIGDLVSANRPRTGHLLILNYCYYPLFSGMVHVKITALSPTRAVF